MSRYDHFRGAVATVCLACVFSTPALAAKSNDVPMFSRSAENATPANAGLKLDLDAHTLLPDAVAEPLDHPAVDDPTRAGRENIAIRRGGQIPKVGTLPSPLPWYRGGLASLGLVLAVIILVAIGLKRATKTSRGGGGGVLQVLTRTHLSPKQSIAVVQMGGRLVFVGITPEQISTLRVVEDREEASLLRGQLRIGDAQSGGMAFDKHLSREAQEFADGMDVGVEANCGKPIPQSGSNRDLKGLLDRLRDFQGERSRRPSANQKLTADS